MPTTGGVDNHMLRFNCRIPIAVVLALIALLSCKLQPGDESKAGCYPYDMRVDVNDKTMIVSWRDQCETAISGYNIYINKRPGQSGSAPFNEQPFPGDTDPSDPVQYFEADGLDNGVKYFVSVRILFPNGSQSKASVEVPVVCGGRGEFELSMRYKSDHDGFSFEKNMPVRANDLSNDIYYYSKDGIDYLASPSRLDGFLRSTKLATLPVSGNLDQVKALALSSLPEPVEDRAEVKVGDWVRIMLPDGKNSLVKALEFIGDGEDRKIKLFYAYSSIANDLVF